MTGVWHHTRTGRPTRPGPSGLARTAVCVVLAVGALLASADKCASDPSAGAPAPPAAAKRHNVVQVYVHGTGRHVWIMFVADARTVDTQTSFHLPYTNEATVSFGAKIEAKNGPDDRGAIECSMTDARGNPAAPTQTAYGANATVTCIADFTRA